MNTIKYFKMIQQHSIEMTHLSDNSQQLQHCLLPRSSAVERAVTSPSHFVAAVSGDWVYWTSWLPCLMQDLPFLLAAAHASYYSVSAMESRASGLARKTPKFSCSTAWGNQGWTRTITDRYYNYYVSSAWVCTIPSNVCISMSLSVHLATVCAPGIL